MKRDWIRNRPKLLDQYFALIFLGFISLVFVGTTIVERKLSGQALEDSTRQRIQTARTLTKIIERDLDANNFDVAWQELNRGVDQKAILGFLLLDASGKPIVEDLDSQAKLETLRNSHAWKSSPQGNPGEAEISTANDLLIISETIQHISTGPSSVRLIYAFNLQDVAAILSLIHWAFRFFFIGLGAVSIVFFFLMRSAFGRSLALISDGVQQILGNQEPRLASQSLMDDYFPSVPFLRRFTEEFRETKEKLREQVKLATFGEIAYQVSHDIGSPLAALDGFLAQTANSKIPEEMRLQLRGAVSSIRDIANDLRLKSIEQKGQSPASQARKPQLLSAIVDFLISQKRIEYRNRMGLEIDFALNRESYGLFADVSSPDLQRVLSNLINNAVQAFPNGRGRVEVRLRTVDEMIRLEVIDNGKGIPDEIRDSLGQRGATYGKETGSGIGLYHARTTIESWKGTFHIDSKVGVGTTVTLSLPRSPAPRWFLESIDLRPGQRVVILDDDGSIHGVWKGRFESLQLDRQGVRVFHFSSASEYRRWRNEVNPDDSPILHLFDYELLGQNETGLDLIAAFGIHENSVLVTSRYEEPAIRDHCERIGVRLLPKPMTGFVPIQCMAPRSRHVDGVMIDDSPGNLMMWSNSARMAGRALVCFPSLEKFLQAEWMLNLASPIYVDWRLGGGLSGADASRRIADLGFTEIIITTNDDAAKKQLPNMPWVKEIRGKLPPWIEPT